MWDPLGSGVNGNGPARLHGCELDLPSRMCPMDEGIRNPGSFLQCRQYTTGSGTIHSM